MTMQVLVEQCRAIGLSVEATPRAAPEPVGAPRSARPAQPAGHSWGLNIASIHQRLKDEMRERSARASSPTAGLQPSPAAAPPATSAGQVCQCLRAAELAAEGCGAHEAGEDGCQPDELACTQLPLAGNPYGTRTPYGTP